MDIQGFEALKKRFIASDTDTRINIYVETDDLTQSQYRELLQMFPLKDLKRLESALG